MDLYNNALGIEIGKKSKSYEDTIRLANEASAKGNVKMLDEQFVPRQYTSLFK